LSAQVIYDNVDRRTTTYMYNLRTTVYNL